MLCIITSFLLLSYPAALDSLNHRLLGLLGLASTGLDTLDDFDRLLFLEEAGNRGRISLGHDPTDFEAVRLCLLIRSLVHVEVLRDAFFIVQSSQRLYLRILGGLGGKFECLQLPGPLTHLIADLGRHDSGFCAAGRQVFLKKHVDVVLSGAVLFLELPDSLVGVGHFSRLLGAKLALIAFVDDRFDLVENVERQLLEVLLQQFSEFDLL